MINKNFYRKTNDKKILHKVGKQWKVVSVALLMAIGGGAALATHANAQQNTNNNYDTNTAAQEVAGNDSVAKYSAAPKPVSSAKVQSAKPASQVSYLSGYNGSAASYKAQASTDQSNYNLNNAIVQGYVNSLNAQYPTQTKSLGSAYNSAADQTSADQSSYASYSAIAAQSGWASKVNSLAAKANMSSSAYIESVGAETSSFNSAVSNDASANSEMSTVDSYANLISELASNSYKNPLMTEMSGNARVAEAKSTAAENYVNNAIQISNDVDEQSSANENSLYDNQASLAANSADEAIAITNAPAEKRYVQSLANSIAGSSYANSSAVSTAVSLMGSEYNQHALSIIAHPVDNDTEGLSYVNDNNSVVAAHQFNDLSEANADAIAGYSGNTKQYRLTVVSEAGTENKYEVESYAVMAKDPTAKAIVEAYTNSASLKLPNKVAIPGDSTAVVSEVSDTAAQFRYDAVNADLTSAVNAENAAVSSYNAQSASASQGVQKALNNSESASSAYQAASVLADTPTFANLFDHTTYGPLTNVSTNTFIHDVEDDADNQLSDTVTNNGHTLYNVRDAINAAIEAVADNDGHDAAHIKSDLENTDMSNALNIAIINLFYSDTDGSGNLKNSPLKDIESSNNVVTNILKALNTNTNNTNLGLTDAMKALGVTIDGSGEIQLGNTLPTIIGAINTAANDTKLQQRLPQQAKGILNSSSYSAAQSLLANITNYSDSAISANFNGGLDYDTAADANTMSAGVRAVNSASNSINTQLASDKASSAVYSSATDASVALAGSYAASYSNDANSDVAVQSAAKTSLDNFYLGHASNASKFGSAMSAANELSNAVPSDNASAEANGLHVYNYGPKYIFVTHAAQLHTATDYGSKDDKVLGKVAKGTPLSVLGVGFAANGATRYVVKVNGHKGYFTGNPYFSQQSYLDAMPNVDVAVNRPVKVYNNGKVVATEKPGYVFKNASVVSMDGIKHGFTRVSVGYNEFVTANVNYVSVNGLAAGNTNASEASQVQSESSNKLVNFQNDLL